MINLFSNPFYLLSPLLGTVIVLALAALIQLKSTRTNSAWLFSFVLISIAVLNILIFGMRSSPDINRALILDKGVPIAALAVYLFYYHFTLAYTGISKQRGPLYAAYLLLAVGIILAPTDLFVKDMRLEDYGYCPVAGPLVPVLFTGYMFFLGGGIFNLARYYRVTSSYEEKNRLAYLVIAGLFPVAGGTLDGFTNLPPASMWANLAFSILCSIVILAHHLFDISLILRKGLLYLTISIIVALPYATVVYLLPHALGVDQESLWIHILAILMLALIFRPLYGWAQEIVDRLFYRGRYDHLRELENFSRQTQSLRELSNLGSTLVRLIGNALRVSRVCLLLPSHDERGFAVTSCIGLENPPDEFLLRNDSPVVKWLQLHGDILSDEKFDVIPQLQSFLAKEKDGLERIGVKLYVPIMTSQGQLSGILVLGKKLSEQDYSGDEKRLLTLLCIQMALALENARLYELEKTARKELEKQDEEKTEFLHSVAHELKTPLTAIISSSEILSEESSIDPSLRERLTNNVIRSALAMNRRVEEILNLAQMQIGELKIKPERLEIGHAITEAAFQLRPLLKKKEQTLTLEIPDSLPEVNADRDRLEQVLFNIISNASKFSPYGSEIFIRAMVKDRRIIVEVEDSSPAISEEEKGKLFNSYYRGEDADGKEHSAGLGLGLSISKKLLELQQGEIWVESKPMQGNTFAFSLPVLERETNGIK